MYNILEKNKKTEKFMPQNYGYQKSLPEVFKELEQAKKIHLANYEAEKKLKEETSFFFHIKHRTKSDNIKLVLLVLAVLLTFSMFSSNYIFAKDLDQEEQKSPIATFEQNYLPVDVYAVMSENMSTTTQKEIFERDEQIEYETNYIDTKDLPKDETRVVQIGLSRFKKSNLC
jgi:hypothetical protein